MILSYYKFSIKESILQSILKFKLRRKNYIGKNCFISKNSHLEGNVTIRDNSKISDGVILNKNVIIGNNAQISNLEAGENTFLDYGVVCTGYGSGRIMIGKECYIGINNVLDWSANITIGNFVHIAGPSTGIWTHSSVNMVMKNIVLENVRSEERKTSPVVIEDNVYIGGGCIIYPGVKISHHSIVAPGSVVTKDVDSYTMVGGVPAIFIKKIEI